MDTQDLSLELFEENIADAELFAESMDERLNSTAAGTVSTVGTISTVYCACCAATFCCYSSKEGVEETVPLDATLR